MKKRSCGVLLEYGNKFLLVRSWGSNTWGIPKGCKEEGETQEEAAIRETAEESGFAVSDPEWFMEYTTKRKNFTVFRKRISKQEFEQTPTCKALAGENVPEIDAFAWVDKETAKVLTHGTHAVQIFNEV